MILQIVQKQNRDYVLLEKAFTNELGHFDREIVRGYLDECEERMEKEIKKFKSLKERNTTARILKTWECE